ncbi:ABC transporter substrate-binding protein [Streptomyces sp. NBC_01210]|uniref:ABC transporter substrate-binding protein n=1 Tax=Streptomyces sp. NBC_01210 TaxID=2903774 RepID=UPI002E12E665|nr:ABC transporter substrate-binding protein [Streptomyces sp. NBC_01210]
MNKRMQLAIAAAVAALGVGASGCSSPGRSTETGGKNPATANEGRVVGGTPVKGGTLTVLSHADYVHLDPTRNWIMPDMGFGIRTLYRTLVTFKAEPGKSGSEIVPDLATDLGTPSNGGRTWKFTLREGVKYEDGTPVTAQDIKYGVERSFSSELSGGADYAVRYLAGTKGYTGPLNGKHLDSIKTPDARTVIFELNRPVADFAYTTTLPTFAPVPQNKEAGAKYDEHPFSSGPYKVQSYERKKRLVLVRNEHWAAETDSVRKAYPEKIVVVMGGERSQIDDRMLASSGADASAVPGGGVDPASVSKVLGNADAAKRLVSEKGACVRMLALNTSRAPFNDPKVRQAMQWAVDKEALVTADGGPALSETATSYLPAALTGGTPQDPLKIPPSGDAQKAKDLLAAAGKKDGLAVKITVAESSKAMAVALQNSLAKAGVKVTIDPVSDDGYYGAVGNTRTAPEMLFAGFCPDYPSGSTMLPPVFGGSAIKETGNISNFSQFDDKATNDRIDEISAMADAQKAAKAWIGLDAEILAKSPAVPLTTRRSSLLVGSNIAGAVGHPIWGGLDFGTIGLKDRSKQTG